MRQIYVIILLTGLMPVQVLAKERLVISQWLKTNALEVFLPMGHDTENTAGSTFSSSDMLVFDQMAMSAYFPEAGMTSSWLHGQSLQWDVAYTDENGYVVFSDSLTPATPMVAYMATYIRSSRWVETQLEVKSPYLLSAWLNGKPIGTKKSLEKEENTMGKVTQTLKLPRGNHLLVIKTLRPAEDGLTWKVMANLEAGEPFVADDIQFGLLPDNTKNISHLLDGVKITSVTPSYDGSYYSISYSNSLPPSDQSESWTEIRRFSDDQMIHSFRHARVSRITWLPKSNAVSYTTVRDGKTTVCYHHLETAEQKVLMEDMENFGGLQWSPDETYLVYTLREDGSGSDAVMRHILGMEDRQSHWRHRSFLYMLHIDSGVKTRLTHGNITTSLQDIHPDGKQLLISMSQPDYEAQPFSVQTLVLLDLHTFAADTLFSRQRHGISASFSPDGNKLLATGSPSAFDGAGINVTEGTIPNNNDTQVYLYDLPTRTATCITREFDPSVSSVKWHRLSNQVFLLTVDKDKRQVYSYDPDRNRFRKVDTGLDYISGMQVSDHGNVMTFLANQVNAPGKAYRLSINNLKVAVLQDTEQYTYKHVRFGDVREWNFTASSGTEITGRYYLPPDFEPDRKYPVIVYYYGGTTPVGRTFGGRYPFNLWAGHGYVVYVLQPSGAIGFGQQFSAAHVNNWGMTVADEIIEGTKAFLEAHSFTDPEKVGCAGASYGGFMTMLLMTRTDMFTTAISHAGISSISSYWGEGYWGYSYSAGATTGNYPWNNLDIYIGQSPLFHADRVNTPLLLLTGDSDTNVPPGESIQMYTALKILGKPVELIMVKDQDHHILTYSKRILWHNAIMAWWDKQLKGEPEWWEDQFPASNY